MRLREDDYALFFTSCFKSIHSALPSKPQIKPVTNSRPHSLLQYTKTPSLTQRLAMHFQFPVIGILHSCFKEKFGIPRQPGLAPLAKAQLELLPPYDDPAAVEGLESASHIWVQFVFHGNSRATWKAKVKPPRLGGNKTMGVFATRSPVRPAPIGLSVVKLEGIEQREGKLLLNLSGVDFQGYLLRRSWLKRVMMLR